MIAPAVSLYQLVLGLHITAVMIGFGVTFAYPLVFTWGRRLDPRHMGWFHRVQTRIGQFIIVPSMIVILVAGIYLASDASQWKEFYVQWGMGAILVLFALGGAFFTPNERRMAELADRDIAAAGDGPVTFSPEYEAINRRVAIVGNLAPLLVVVTIFFMAVKP